MRVILINASGRNYYSSRKLSGTKLSRADQSLTIRAIQMALEGRGIDLLLYPQADFYIKQNSGTFELEAEAAETFKRDFAALAGDTDQVIFGITTESESYWLWEAMCRIIRAEFPKATIIGGGPHFRREHLLAGGQKVHDSVEVALGNNLADGLVVGGCSPFIDYLSSAGQEFSRVFEPGLYWLQGREVAGQGWGRAPRLDKVPYIRINNTIGVLFRNACENRCNFCSIVWSKPNYSELAIQRTVDELAAADARSLEIYDPNIFEPRQLDFYLKTLAAIKKPMKSVSLDPSLLLLDHDFYRSLLEGKLLEELGVLSYFFGREVVTEAEAAKIGVKYRGKIKSQEQLDKEGEALKAFLMAGVEARLQAPKLYPSEHLKFGFNASISYLLSPFDSMESVIRKTEEMRRFRFGRPGGVLNFRTQYQILVPFPGTRIRRQYIEHIKDPEDYAALSLDRSVWRESLGPQVAFLESFVSEDEFYSRNLGREGQSYDDYIDDLLESCF